MPIKNLVLEYGSKEHVERLFKAHSASGIGKRNVEEIEIISFSLNFRDSRIQNA